MKKLCQSVNLINTVRDSKRLEETEYFSSKEKMVAVFFFVCLIKTSCYNRECLKSQEFNPIKVQLLSQSIERFPGQQASVGLFRDPASSMLYGPHYHLLTTLVWKRLLSLMLTFFGEELYTNHVKKTGKYGSWLESHLTSTAVHCKRGSLYMWQGGQLSISATFSFFVTFQEADTPCVGWQ